MVQLFHQPNAPSDRALGQIGETFSICPSFDVDDQLSGLIRDPAKRLEVQSPLGEKRAAIQGEFLFAEGSGWSV